jgi:hypothetical protein
MARIGLWMHKKYCLHDGGVTCGNVRRYVGAIRKVKKYHYSKGGRNNKVGHGKVCPTFV